MEETTPSNTADTDTMPDKPAKKYLALGDSYTIGVSVAEPDRYPVQTAALLQTLGIGAVKTEIIAANGWTTADLSGAMDNTRLENSYDAVSLLIGVNNQYQGRTLEEYREQFTTLVRRAVELAGGKPGHVFVLSIPDYSVTPFAKGRNLAEIAAAIDRFNDANRSIAAIYKTQYLDITAESRKAANDPGLVAADGLHFSGKEYAVWAAVLAPLIKTAIQ